MLRSFLCSIILWYRMMYATSLYADNKTCHSIVLFSYCAPWMTISRFPLIFIADLLPFESLKSNSNFCVLFKNVLNFHFVQNFKRANHFTCFLKHALILFRKQFKLYINCLPSAASLCSYYTFCNCCPENSGSWKMERFLCLLAFKTLRPKTTSLLSARIGLLFNLTAKKDWFWPK